MRRDGKDLGRGAIYLPVAKIWFILASFALNFGLPNLLDPDGVGDFGVINRLVSLINMVMITGTIQSVSKFVSEDPNRASAMRRWALRAQVCFSGLVCVMYYLSAEALANLFNDPELAVYFRISAVIPFFYALYAVHIGIFNGLKDFTRQAGFDIGYSTLRAAGLLGAAALGYGVGGVFVAFVGAAGMILVIATMMDRGSGHSSHVHSSHVLDVRTADILRFAIPVMVLVLVTQWLLSFDLFLVKALLPPERSSLLAGAYFAMLNLVLVPYMLVVSISFIVFPMISRSTFDDDRESTSTYIKQSLRVALLLAVVAEIVILASPESALGMVYPSKPEYAAHARALQILSPGYVCLCLFGVMTTIVNGAGHPRVSLMAGIFTLGLQGVLCYVLIGGSGLEGAALASTIAFMTGTLGLSLYMFRQLGAWIERVTLLRVAIAAAVGIQFGKAVEWTGVLFLAEAILTAGVFLIVLVILREVGMTDMNRLMRMARTNG